MVLKKPELDEDDQLMLAVQIELEKTVTKEVCDAVYDTAKLSPTALTAENIDSECRNRRDVIMGVIANSVSLERLYFIIRSSIMGGFTGILTFTIVSALKITGFSQLVFLGISIFIVSLIASRFFDKSVVKLSSKIIAYLRKHKRIQDFILKRF